ncbi:MAG: hypothetical protein O3B13_26100 [Planctomycetota bacterium]|nr:hypothetical protein [Planctomycetota bacterium]
MNLFRADFGELYRRHLCRHGGFGINVLHLVAVVGVYLSLLELAFSLPAAEWVIGTLLAIYAAVLGCNVPLRLIALTTAVIGVLIAVCLALPAVNPWVYVGALIASHRFQLWHHRVFPQSLDMAEFNAKYRKGPALFVLLAVYELPILLNYVAYEGDQPLRNTLASSES